MQIQLRGHDFKVDSNFEESIGVYGRVFWEKVGSSNYEIETFRFIEKSFSKGKKKFIDIGAATGCMTLYAASIGYDVVALEPQSEIFEALERNVTLNPALSERIKCMETLLVSGYKSQSEREFFTQGTEGPLATNPSTLTQTDALTLLQGINDRAGFSLKMDIEGAEFSMLRDENLLAFLRSNRSILFLSFHPGFQSPLPNSPKFGQKIVWRVSTLFDTIKFVALLAKYSKITFKNEENFLSPLKVVGRIIQGERDFTLYF